MGSKLTFLCSKPTLKDFWKEHPEKKKNRQILLVGRSNVGKSSLLNHLFDSKSAKTAKKPGKTVMLQFFHTDLGVFVDLPGYGFAKAAKSIKERWEKEILTVLEDNDNLACVLFLLSIERDPTTNDQQMYAWLQARNIPTIPLFTKTDKLSKEKQKKREKAMQEILDVPFYIPYSVKYLSGKKELISRLKHGTFT